MRQQEKRGVDSPFIEELWLGLVYQLADTQEWINSMAGKLLLQLPICGQAGLQQPGYSLSISALAHILRQHYSPNKNSCFRLPVPAIVALLIEAGKLEPVVLPSSP